MSELQFLAELDDALLESADHMRQIEAQLALLGQAIHRAGIMRSRLSAAYERAIMERDRHDNN